MKKPKHKQPKPRIVKLKPRDYQPRKAELEEPVILRNPDGSRATVDDIVEAVLRPVKIVEDPDA